MVQIYFFFYSVNVQRAHLIFGGIGLNAGGAELSVQVQVRPRRRVEQLVNSRISVYVYVVLTCINMRDFAA